MLVIFIIVESISWVLNQYLYLTCFSKSLHPIWNSVYFHRSVQILNSQWASDKMGERLFLLELCVSLDPKVSVEMSLCSLCTMRWCVLRVSSLTIIPPLPWPGHWHAWRPLCTGQSPLCLPTQPEFLSSFLNTVCSISYLSCWTFWLLFFFCSQTCPAQDTNITFPSPQIPCTPLATMGKPQSLSPLSSPEMWALFWDSSFPGLANSIFKPNRLQRQPVTFLFQLSKAIIPCVFLILVNDIKTHSVQQVKYFHISLYSPLQSTFKATSLCGVTANPKFPTSAGALVSHCLAWLGDTEADLAFPVIITLMP